MKKIIEYIKLIAKSNANVLITGESGTGKEVISNMIHQMSVRKNKKFVAINCAAIPSNLLESEMFGHEKGAFTGAQTRRIGKFEEANYGTLLLDEISEMDIKLQSKLLRAIQEKTISRIGGNNIVDLDTRIIATSNRNLQHEIQNNNFRADLFFRLNIFSINVPSLAERKEDIALLADFFIGKYCTANNLETKTISDKALQKLYDYHWPGNIRELENIIHRAVLLSQSNEINDEVIWYDFSDNNFVARTIKEVETELIFDTIKHCKGNKTHAAKILGISVDNLSSKLSTV